MITKSRIVTIGILFVLKFLFGFQLYCTGKPYNAIVLAIHKVLSLGIVVLLVLGTNNARGRLDTALVMATVITGVLFVLAIATGGLLSTDKPVPAIVSVVHKVVPVLSVLSTAIMLYLLVLGL